MSTPRRTRSGGAWIALALLSVVGLDRAAAPTSGLIGYWRLDETSGITASDSSTGGHPGTLSNGPVWVAGRVGNALQFDAIDNGNDADDPRVTIGTGFDVALPFTISAWVKPSSYTDYRAIFSKRDSYSSSGMRFQWYLTRNSGRVTIGRIGSARTFNYAPPLGTWTHMTVVLTSGSTVLYVNGQSSQSAGGIVLGTKATANTVIGNTGEPAASGDGDPFDGAIDELRVYNRALTAQEVASLVEGAAVPDTQAPSVPAGLTAAAASSSQINLAWSASTDDVAVTGYRVERCQGSNCTSFAQIAVPTGTTHSDTGLAPSTTYRYRVRAADAAGNLSGYSSIASATTQAGSSGSTSYGLEWPGTGTTRRMLYWANPHTKGLPIYDATYIFKVYPRRKAPGTCYLTSGNCNNRYWTTFFWGNNGTFTWDGGSANTYYGAHPYPVPPPNGTQMWEISVYHGDLTTGTEVAWNRWYTQAFVAWRVSSTQTEHRFYYDLPDLTKVLSKTIQGDPGWADQNPPSPAVVMGQAPALFPGSIQSWGGYPGWEEFSGIIRGIQIYNNDLSIADIQAEIATPKSTAAGAASIWYLNLDPRPSDVTDKKATGTAHNPTWDGTTALEWSSGGTADTTAPSVPTGLTATAVSSSRIDLSWNASTDNVGVAGYRVYRSGVLLGSVSTTAYSNTGLVPDTLYSYTVLAYDAAGNASAQSSAVSARTLLTVDTTAPSVPTGLTATAVSSSRIDLSWNASTDNVGVAGYRVYRGGVLLGSVSTTAYSNTGLVPDTLYSYTVLAYDAAGNASAQSSAVSARTLLTVDTTPPAISAVAASGVSASGATITWTTNEPADTQVQYGLTTSYGSQTPLNGSLVTSHSQALTGLAAATTYQYRVLSRDAAGNLATSANFSFTTASAPAGGDITTGLVAYWKLDEGSGTQAGDSAGSTTGTLANGPTWTTGRVRQALQFTASDNGNDSDDPRVNLGTAFNVSLPLTIATWVKPQSYSDYRAIFSKRDAYSAATMRFDLGLHRSTGQVYVGHASSKRTFSYTPPTNTWTHLTVVLTSTAATLYVNGTLLQTQSAITLGTGTSAKTAIGNTGEGSGGDGDPFLGAIDEVRVYGRALSAGDVQALFAYQ